MYVLLLAVVLLLLSYGVWVLRNVDYVKYGSRLYTVLTDISMALVMLSAVSFGWVFGGFLLWLWGV